MLQTGHMFLLNTCIKKNILIGDSVFLLSASVCHFPTGSNGVLSMSKPSNWLSTVKRCSLTPPTTFLRAKEREDSNTEGAELMKLYPGRMGIKF